MIYTMYIALTAKDNKLQPQNITNIPVNCNETISNSIVEFDNLFSFGKHIFS